MKDCDKPIIGIVPRTMKSLINSNIQLVEENYRNFILKSGGIPFLILPPQIVDYEDTKPKDVTKLTDLDKQNLNTILDMCDGILAPGGLKAYEFDYYISSYAKEKNIPYLGICLGMQVMARESGNALIVKNEESCNHHVPEKKYAHEIKIKENSFLHDILLKKNIKVNSFHKYHVENLEKIDVSAVSNDGIVEAVEEKNNNFRLGVQWHPEKLMDDENSKKIFDKFIEASKEFKKRK